MVRSILNHVSLTRSLAIMAALTWAAFSPFLIAQQGEPKTPPKTITINSLSMEVNALQALHQLQVSESQLNQLQKWAEESMPKDQQRKPGKASKEYRDKLQELRKALQDAKDGDLIAKLVGEVDALHEKEKPTLDDRVEITEAARKRAVEAYRLLKPGQVAAYLGQIADSIHDPRDLLLDALEDVRNMNEEDWKDQRGEIADEISRAAVGLNAAKAKAMSAQIAVLLTRARGLSKAEFQKQHAEIESAASKLIGDISPEVLLRNQVEVDLAMLLSNPRTPQAARALLKVTSQAKTPSKK
ncbi:unnamed protein product [uncultured bacterium]|nr:unnamed protein product [uncultured bacterium]